MLRVVKSVYETESDAAIYGIHEVSYISKDEVEIGPIIISGDSKEDLKTLVEGLYSALDDETIVVGM